MGSASHERLVALLGASHIRILRNIMNENQHARVLIIGAGSMGIATGYRSSGDQVGSNH